MKWTIGPTEKINPFEEGAECLNKTWPWKGLFRQLWCCPPIDQTIIFSFQFLHFEATFLVENLILTFRLCADLKKIGTL